MTFVAIGVQALGLALAFEGTRMFLAEFSAKCVFASHLAIRV